ncbi:Hypothetical predicted protein [Olea europaea subsp. europaea]|uniref:Uncharacterized protein n=1 Tax=Olea europaea subsp. europaea TaxID=158383 RepID=A0A8S0T3C2_OLEEU|nr:Hypothetical predicted protein [Olea europaea subsp. europaea]
MEFDYCIPEKARLRAQISQRSNLKYVKTVMDLFDDLQRDEFRNSPSGNMMRFGLQEYILVTGLRCGVFPEGDEFDRVLERKRLKERRQEKEVTYTIHGFPIAMQVWAYQAVLEIGERFGQRVGKRMPRLLRWSAQKQPQHRTYNAFFKNMRLHVYATLRPTDAEAEQQYFSTLVPYDDPPVPVLDEIARNVVGPQFNASHGGSGSGGQLVRQESDDEVSSGGSGEDERLEMKVPIPRRVAKAPVSDPASVRILVEDRSVHPPHLQRPTFLLQCEGRRWRHCQLAHPDQASPKRRWKSYCSTKELSLKYDSALSSLKSNST